MEPERRMIMAAVLLAVAQQDPKNVKWLGVRPSQVEVLSRAIAFEAFQFVASKDFDEMCKVIDVEADTLRKMDPKRALELYETLTHDNWGKHDTKI